MHLTTCLNSKTVFPLGLIILETCSLVFVWNSQYIYKFTSRSTTVPTNYAMTPLRSHSLIVILFLVTTWLAVFVFLSDLSFLLCYYWHYCRYSSLVNTRSLVALFLLFFLLLC